MNCKDLDKIMKAMDPNNLEKISTQICEKMEKEGKTLKEAIGINDAMENEVYVLAKHYYELCKYQEAITLFTALCKIDPNNFNYAYGLASAYHQSGDFINASLGYYTSFLIEPTNPLSTYYLADCFMNLQSEEDARNFLDTTICIVEANKDATQYPLAERCKLIKSSLKSTPGSTKAPI